MVGRRSVEALCGGGVLSNRRRDVIVFFKIVVVSRPGAVDATVYNSAVYRKLIV